MSKVIEVKNLTKTFRDGDAKVNALHNISFELNEGENLAIIGTSGSGKTTLLHLLGGLEKSSEGDIFLVGKSISSMNDKALSKFRNQTIGFVFQFFYLLEYLTAKENVALPAIIKTGKRKASLKKAEELLEAVGLSHRMNHYPNQISGGEMQRIAVARALINDPKIILADEPTGNLDKENAERILNIFDEISKQKGVSVVVITHDNWISQKFENVLKLDKGKLLQS